MGERDIADRCTACGAPMDPDDTELWCIDCEHDHAQLIEPEEPRSTTLAYSDERDRDRMAWQRTYGGSVVDWDAYADVFVEDLW